MDGKCPRKCGKGRGHREAATWQTGGQQEQKRSGIEDYRWGSPIYGKTYSENPCQFPALQAGIPRDGTFLSWREHLLYSQLPCSQRQTVSVRLPVMIRRAFL